MLHLGHWFNIWCVVLTLPNVANLWFIQIVILPKIHTWVHFWFWCISFARSLKVSDIKCTWSKLQAKYTTHSQHILMFPLIVYYGNFYFVNILSPQKQCDTFNLTFLAYSCTCIYSMHPIFQYPRVYMVFIFTVLLLYDSDHWKLYVSFLTYKSPELKTGNSFNLSVQHISCIHCTGTNRLHCPI